MTPKSLYQILDVPTDASEREIKRSYHSLAKRLHPDKVTDPRASKDLEEQLALVSQAYNVLKDKGRRQEYDTQLKAERALVSDDGTGARRSAPKAASVKVPGERASVTERRATIAQKALTKGVQLLKAGEPKRAVEFLDAALANNDQDAMAHAKLAEALLQSNRGFSRASSHAEKSIELDPWNVDYRLMLARIYEESGIKSRALEVYEEILKWDAGNGLARAKLQELGKRRIGPRGMPFGDLLNRFFGRGG